MSMKIKEGDIVTIKAKVLATGDACGDISVGLPGDGDWFWIPRKRITSVETPPYVPKPGEWFTWGDGSSGYQCVWADEKSVLYQRGNIRNVLNSDREFCQPRPCKGPEGDRS